MAICFLSIAPTAWGTITPDSELLFYLFPAFRVSRAAQIFVLGFSNDILADLGDAFTDGGLANQPVILQGSSLLLPDVSVLLSGGWLWCWV